MGCTVDMTDTGVTIEVHKFDTKLDAMNYLTVARHYHYERHETWGFTTGIDFYQGPNPGERASLRETPFVDGRIVSYLWSVAFWVTK